MTEVVVRGWPDLSEATLKEWQALQAVVHGSPEQRQQQARLVWAPLDLWLLVLLSSAMAVPFYQALGWRVVDGRCAASSRAARSSSTMSIEAPAMLLVRDGVNWPTGDLDVGGLPF